MNKFHQELISTKRAIKEKMLTLVLAAFGLVAALAWNDAIRSLFDTLFPQKQALVGKFLYAAFITVVVVIISNMLGKLLAEKENK